MNAEREGVIKYTLEHSPSAPVSQSIELKKLLAWRTVMHRLGMIGQDPDRYGGFGFGNVSQRLDEECFVITGTQTGACERLGLDRLAEVLRCDLAANRIVSRGPIKPSSEALTHGAVYRLNPAIHSVLHGHSPDIWQHAGLCGIPATPAEVAYGTPEMATCVAELCCRHDLAESGLFIMAGHQDGVVSFGPDAGCAGRLMLDALAGVFQQ